MIKIIRVLLEVRRDPGVETDFMNLKLFLSGEEVRIAVKPIWVIAYVTSEARVVFMTYSGKVKMPFQQWRSTRGFAFLQEIEVY